MYQKKQNIKKEQTRQEMYAQYINSKRTEIQEAMKNQRQILVDNYLPIQETKE